MNDRTSSMTNRSDACLSKIGFSPNEDFAFRTSKTSTADSRSSLGTFRYLSRSSQISTLEYIRNAANIVSSVEFGSHCDRSIGWSTLMRSGSFSPHSSVTKPILALQSSSFSLVTSVHILSSQSIVSSLSKNNAVAGAGGGGAGVAPAVRGGSAGGFWACPCSEAISDAVRG